MAFKTTVAGIKGFNKDMEDLAKEETPISLAKILATSLREPSILYIFPIPTIIEVCIKISTGVSAKGIGTAPTVTALATHAEI